MRWVGRLFLVPTGLLLAIAASGLFFLVASVIDPVLAALTGNAVFVGLWSLMDALSASEDPAPLLEGAAAGLGRLALTFLVAPPVFVALLSEIAGVRRLLWHLVATGLLTAALPWLLRGSGRVQSAAELHVAVVLGLTGAVAGLVYWAIAGRSAGSPPRIAASVPRPPGS